MKPRTLYKARIKGGIASANGNNGENMASDNAFVLNECHLRTNNILSSNSLETEGDLPHGQMFQLSWKGLCVFHQRLINIVWEVVYRVMKLPWLSLISCNTLLTQKNPNMENIDCNQLLCSLLPLILQIVPVHKDSSTKVKVNFVHIQLVIDLASYP